MVSVTFDVDWSRATWLAFGAVLLGAAVFVLHAFVGTFVFGLFIYYATRRLYRRLRPRVGPPSVAAALALVVLALPAVALIAYTVAIAVQELRRFSETADLQPLLDVVGPYMPLTQLVEDPASLASGLTLSGAGATASSLLESLTVAGTGLLHLFVMFALAFYLLRDGDRFGTWLSTYGDEYEVFTAYIAAVDASFDKVFYGNILNAAVTGGIGAVVYSLLNVVAPTAVSIPYPALTGLLTGIASLIPIVGMKLVYVPLAIYLASQAFLVGSGWVFVALFVGVSFAIVDVIPDLLIRPYVSGGGLHVGALMLAYVLGPLLFGWYGIFLGPILLILVAHFARIVLPELLAQHPIEPAAVDPSQLVASDDDQP